jgi:phosphoribosylformylglycinamidine synthase subunit PurL
MLDEKIIKDHGLTLEEYAFIVKLIGKDPNLTELGIFSVMWSEHCGYKSSRVYLKGLPVKGKHVIQGPGENAGILDIGDGLAVVFKIESHNHPSYIEPYQGAATGVGGILRDIFTMGARPIAVMDSLHFGPLDVPQNKTIMEGVVSGIAGYGNSIGIPTVGGEIYFHEGYAQNPLVNVFALGLAEKEKLFYAKAEGTGNPVLYVGAKTGRDGIHGATMASAEFGKDTEHKRPNVQVGDPFKEKLLVEACLEVMSTDMIVGIQDMGAAGLTCSTTEMAAKAGTGMDVDLDLVPQREEGMTPYEILLSESQERMLICAKKDRVKEVQAIFAKWDLDAVIIGHVTEGGRLKARFKGELVVDIPVDAVVNLCPAYRRPIKKPAYLGPVSRLPEIPVPADLEDVFFKLISSPTIADKEWVFRQYDHMIQINTAVLPGADAAVLRIKGSKRALAMTLDGNPHYAYLDPAQGGRIAVAEACRNLACVGARPIGVTNCLNFGNPEKPEIMWQFKEAVRGMSEACRAFEIPVTGGNVSLYNDTEGTSILPTPVMGIVGLIEDIDKTVRPGFRTRGDTVILLGENREEIGGSEYLRTVHGLEKGKAPLLDLGTERKLHEMCLEAIDGGLLKSAHDVSEGGLAVCLAECAFHSEKKLGCSVRLQDHIRLDALLFGETQGRIVVTTSQARAKKVIALAIKRGVKAAVIGRTGGSDIVVEAGRREPLRIPVLKAFEAWKKAIPAHYAVKA